MSWPCPSQFLSSRVRPQDCDWGSDTKSKEMLGSRLLALLAVASAEPKEQWNDPAGAPKCVDKWQKWTDGFAAGERAITMFSQSYVCDGNDCDVVGAYSPKYSFACATKGPGGQIWDHRSSVLASHFFDMLLSWI